MPPSSSWDRVAAQGQRSSVPRSSPEGPLPTQCRAPSGTEQGPQRGEARRLKPTSALSQTKAA
eukprot:10737832-Alexandrium_andersonii.AAC.1